MRIQKVMIGMGFLFSASVYAQDCSQIISDLQGMRKAQNNIEMSLISNHEMFATTLESYSEALSETAGRIHKTVSTNMSSSARSFRDRGLKAQITAQKLDAATAGLIQKISKCLK